MEWTEEIIKYVEKAYDGLSEELECEILEDENSRNCNICWLNLNLYVD